MRPIWGMSVKMRRRMIIGVQPPPPPQQQVQPPPQPQQHQVQPPPQGAEPSRVQQPPPSAQQQGPVFGDVADRAAKIYLSALRRKFPPEVMAALEREVTTIWRAAFDQMVQAFPLKH